MGDLLFFCCMYPECHQPECVAPNVQLLNNSEVLILEHGNKELIKLWGQSRARLIVSMRFYILHAWQNLTCKQCLEDSSEDNWRTASAFKLVKFIPQFLAPAWSVAVGYCLIARVLIVLIYSIGGKITRMVRIREDYGVRSVQSILILFYALPFVCGRKWA